jgi:hypothetical protein
MVLMTPQSDQLDRRLDAIAMLEAALHGDHEAVRTLLNASDEPEHWRSVTSILVGMFAGMMRGDPNHDAFIVWIGERTLTGKIGYEPE